jgi:hypothetical protein
MTIDRWSWAQLDDEELDLVKETEAAIGADYVLVFDRGGGVSVSDVPGVRPSELDESQIERLQDVERQLGSVAVAYQRED